MNQTENQEQRAAMLGEIILSSRKVESFLHMLCGSTEVTGIHALTELLGSKLPDELKRKLHYIATVRNHAAHEDTFEISAEDFAGYKRTVEETLNGLQAVFPEKTSAENPTDNSKNHTAADLAVERELFKRISGRLSLLGYLPAVGNVYTAYLLLYTTLKQGYLLLLTMVYACSAVLAVKCCTAADRVDRGLIYVAAAAFLIAYICTVILCFKQPLKHISRGWGLLPGFNIIYLPVRWLCDLEWIKFTVALFGLAAIAGAGFLMYKQLYIYAAYAAAVSWVLSATAAFIWGNKCEEE